jgi:Haem-binding domain
MNMVRVKRLVIALVALFILAQLFQPSRTNPPVVQSKTIEAHLQVPVPVQGILKRACGDCHSNQTVWPWYSHVAPVSWLVGSDVSTGRRHINFSDWEAQKSPKDANEHLELICKDTRDGGMPPFAYRLMHKQSRLTPQDINELCAWTKTVVTAVNTIH